MSRWGVWFVPIACTVWASSSCGGNSVERRQGGPDQGGSPTGGGGAGNAGGERSGGEAGIHTDPPGDGGTASGGEGTGGGAAGAGVGGGSGAGDGGEPPLPACGATRDCIGSFFLHRSDAEPCTLPTRDTTPSVRDPDCETDDDRCSIEQHSCDTDLDCGSDSYCTFERQDDIDGYLTWIYISCSRYCQTDAECGPGAICLCNGVTKNATRELVSMGTCTPAECSSDDCANGYQCISPTARRHVQTFHCQSAEDECWGPEDCPPGPARCESFSTCTFDGHFRCGFGSDSEEDGCEFAP
jgi:hypothetical protein